MDIYLRYYVFWKSWCYITDRSTISDVFNDEHRSSNNRTSCFQTNLDCVYNIIMVISEFGKTTGNVRCQHSSVIVILAYHLEWWRKVPLSRPFLARIHGTLNRSRYISVVLKHVALPFVLALWQAIFQQDNTRLNVTGVVQTFLNSENVLMLPWFFRSFHL